MRTLDRYILRQFLLNFIILAVVTVSLVIVVDLILDPSEFVQAGQIRAASVGSTFLGTLYALVDYWYPLIYLLYVFFCGMVVVAAMGFTFANFSRTGELVAMVTSGISMYRVAAPVIVVGCALNLLALPIQEFVIPPLAQKILRGKSEVAHESYKTFHVWYLRDQNGNLLSAAKFDPTTRTLSQVSILVRNAKHEAVERITAEAAHWQSARPGQAEGWVLENGREVSRLVPTDAGSASITPTRSIQFYPCDLAPDVVLARQAAIYPRLLALSTLLRMAGNPAADPPTILLIINSRFTFIILNSLLMVLAMPFFLTREPVNYMVQALKATGLCMSVWAAGMFLMQGGVSIGQPVTEAWAPILLCLPLVWWMATLVKT